MEKEQKNRKRSRSKTKSKSPKKSQNLDYVRDFQQCLARMKQRSLKDASISKLREIISTFTTFSSINTFVQLLTIHSKGTQKSMDKVSELYIFSLICEQILGRVKQDEDFGGKGRLKKMTSDVVKSLTEQYLYVEDRRIGERLSDVFGILRTYCGYSEKLFGCIDFLYGHLYEFILRSLRGHHAMDIAFYCIRKLYNQEIVNKEDDRVGRIVQLIEDNFWKCFKKVKMKSRNFYEMLKAVFENIKSDPEKSLGSHTGELIQRMIEDLGHYAATKPNECQVEKIQIYQILSLIAKTAEKGDLHKAISLDTSKKVIEAIKSINTSRVMKVKLQANQAGLDWNHLQTVIMNENNVKDYQNSVLENKSKIPFKAKKKEKNPFENDNTSITGLLRAKNFLKKGSGNGGGGEGFGPSDYKSTRTNVDRVKNKNYRVMRVQREKKFSNSRIRNPSKIKGAKEKKDKKKAFRVKKVINLEDSLEKVDIKLKEPSGDVQNVFEFAKDEEGQNAAVPQRKRSPRKSKSPLKKKYNFRNKKNSSEGRIENKRVRTRNNRIDRKKSSLKIKNRFLKVMSHVVDNDSFQEVEHRIEEEETPNKKRKRDNMVKRGVNKLKKNKKRKGEERKKKRDAVVEEKQEDHEDKRNRIMDLNTISKKDREEKGEKEKKNMAVKSEKVDSANTCQMTFGHIEPAGVSKLIPPVNFSMGVKHERSSPLNSGPSSERSNPMKTLQARRDSVKSKKSKKFTFKRGKKSRAKPKMEMEDVGNKEENFSLEISEEEVKMAVKFRTLNLAKSQGDVVDEDLLDIVDYEAMQDEEEIEALEKEGLERKSKERQDMIRKTELTQTMKDFKKKEIPESVSVLDLYDFEEMNMKQDEQDLENMEDGGTDLEEEELAGFEVEESHPSGKTDEKEDTLDILESDFNENASDGITLTGEDEHQEVEHEEDPEEATFRFDLRNSSTANFKDKKVPFVNFGYMQETEECEDELEDTIRFGEVEDLSESLSSTIDYRAPPVKLFKKTIPKMSMTPAPLKIVFKEKHNLRSHLQKISLRASTDLKNLSNPKKIDWYAKVDLEMARMEAKVIKLAKYFPELRSKSIEINKRNYDKLIMYYDSSDRKVEDLWKIILRCLDNNDFGIAFEIALKIENHPFTFLQLCRTTGGQIMRSLDKEINKKIIQKLIKIFSKKKIEKIQYQFLTGYMNLRNRPVP